MTNTASQQSRDAATEPQDPDKKDSHGGQWGMLAQTDKVSVPVK